MARLRPAIGKRRMEPTATGRGLVIMLAARFTAIAVVTLAMFACPTLVDAKGGHGGGHGRGGGHGGGHGGGRAHAAHIRSHVPHIRSSRAASIRSARAFARPFAGARSFAIRGIANPAFARFAAVRGGRSPGLLLYPALAWPVLYSGLFWADDYYEFWPYRYDTIVEGAFSSGYGPQFSRRSRYGDFTLAEPMAMARMCQDQALRAPDETITGIAQTVEPTEAQRGILDELRSAMTETATLLRGACPSDIPVNPIARLEVMEKQIDVMSQAFETLRPPLQKFERSLSEPQHARFVAMTARASRQAERHANSDICGQAASLTRFPTDRIAEAVRPNATQRNALIDLSAASAKAANVLDADCPREAATTPLGRLQSMTERLKAAHQAVDTMRVAAAAFYGTLGDEQKARFDRMNLPTNRVSR